MSRRLDDYLASVERHLRHLPAPVRENEVRELRSHLEQLRDDFAAQGQNPEMAAQSALNQFGDARAVAVRLRDVWEGQSFSWKRVLAALVCGFVFWLGAAYALVEGALTFYFWPQAPLFPELRTLLSAYVLLMPFLTGMIFSAWLGRRAWMLSVVFFWFTTVPYLLAVNNSPPTINAQPLRAVCWSVGLGIAGALAGDALMRRRRYAQLALAGSPAGTAEISSSFQPARRKKLPLKLIVALVVSLATVAGAKWRIDTVLRPQTPVAGLRAKLFSDRDVTEQEPPKIHELRELPPQTPAERAGLERRVAFHIELSATEEYAARRVAYLESLLKSKQKKSSRGEESLRSSLRRVRANSHPIRGVATLKKTSDGWQVEEKSFDWSQLQGWLLDLYFDH